MHMCICDIVQHMGGVLMTHAWYFLLKCMWAKWGLDVRLYHTSVKDYLKKQPVFLDFSPSLYLRFNHPNFSVKMLTLCVL